MRQCYDGTAGLLVCPATVTTAPPAKTTGDPWFNSIWTYAGVPSLNIPCGLATDGLPVGLQLLTGFGQDLRAARMAQHLEQILAFDDRPKLLHA